MMDIYTRDPLWLELSIAAHMDLEILVSTTYEMEGERLEILLLFSRFEAIRQLGRSLRDDDTNRGVLQNVYALIRRNAKTPKEGLVFTKQLPGHGSSTGRIVSIEVVDDEKVLKVAYGDDDDQEELGEGEIMGLLDVYGDGLHQRVIDAIFPLSITSRTASRASARHSSTAHTLTPSVGYSNSSTRRTLPSMRRQLTQPQSVNLPSVFLLQWSEVGGC